MTTFESELNEVGPMPATNSKPLSVPEAERGAIGCAILDGNLAPDLRLDWFYDLRYRTAAEVLQKLAAEAQPIDEITVSQALGERGVADPSVLVSECMDGAPSPANWPYWRSKLIEALAIRSIQKVAQEASQEASRGDKPALEQLEAFEREALAIRQTVTGADCDEVDLRATLRELTEDYEIAHTSGRPTGIATGFPDLDKLIGGLKPQQLAIIAARPSVGKTALALNIAENVAVGGKIPVAFFSLEMSGKELLNRLACSRARVDGMSLNDGTSTEADRRALAVALGQIVKAPLHIVDRGGLTIGQVTAQARRLAQRHGIKLLVVDYLGLILSGQKTKGRYEDTTLVSSGLKSIAKELNIPVIALAQLNRESERQEREPMLSDLRDSGALEQDGDIIALLHRPADQGDGDDVAIKLKLAKQRNGRTGSVRLVFRSRFTRFDSVERTRPDDVT